MYRIEHSQCFLNLKSESQNVDAKGKHQSISCSGVS